jgi:hypothetical protein
MRGPTELNTSSFLATSQFLIARRRFPVYCEEDHRTPTRILCSGANEIRDSTVRVVSRAAQFESALNNTGI